MLRRLVEILTRIIPSCSICWESWLRNCCYDEKLLPLLIFHFSGTLCWSFLEICPGLLFSLSHKNNLQSSSAWCLVTEKILFLQSDNLLHSTQKLSRKTALEKRLQAQLPGCVYSTALCRWRRYNLDFLSLTLSWPVISKHSMSRRKYGHGECKGRSSPELFAPSASRFYRRSIIAWKFRFYTSVKQEVMDFRDGDY